VERRRQARRANLRKTTARLEEGESIKPSDFVGDSDAAIEVEQVGTAPEQHVLTVVYRLPGPRMLIRRSPATDERSPLEKTHSESGIGQSAAGREASNASAYDSYSRSLFFVRHRLSKVQSDARIFADL
jgi:hypothetical protein